MYGFFFSLSALGVSRCMYLRTARSAFPTKAQAAPLNLPNRLAEYYRCSRRIHEMLRAMSKDEEEGDEGTGSGGNARHHYSSKTVKSPSEVHRSHGVPFIRTAGNLREDGSETSFSILDVKYSDKGASGLYSGNASSGGLLWSGENEDAPSDTGRRTSERTRVHDEEEASKSPFSRSSHQEISSSTSVQSIATTTGLSSPEQGSYSPGKRESVSTAVPENENDMFAETVYLSHDEKEKTINSQLASISQKKKGKRMSYERFYTKNRSSRNAQGSSKGRPSSGKSTGFPESGTKKDAPENVNLQQHFRRLLRSVNSRIEEEFGERRASSSCFSNTSRNLLSEGLAPSNRKMRSEDLFADSA